MRIIGIKSHKIRRLEITINFFIGVATFEFDESGNMIENIVILSKRINLVVDGDEVQKLTDSTKRAFLLLGNLTLEQKIY